MGSHSTSDDPSRYRDPALLEPWKKKDPIHRFRDYLEDRKLWNAEDEKRLVKEWDTRITDTLAEVEKLPAPAIETMFQDVYAEQPWHLREQYAEAEQARSAGE
jgi:TPP-dependent pyruvate/acetoin dehydrogenase alpha subunit